VTATIQLPAGILAAVSTRYQSGYPVSISQASNNTGLLGSTQRPNVAAGVDPSGGSDLQWLNPLAWTAAPAFTFGNAPRTDDRVRTPSEKETDLSVQKAMPFHGATLSVRADLLNLFNSPLFLGPVTTFGVATFGQIQNVGR
jgi:hypothetical protein